MPQVERTDSAVYGYPSIKIKGTPLTDTMEVAEVVVDLDATRPGMFVIRFLQSVAPGSESSIDIAVGDEVEVGEQSSSTTLIKGEVTSIEADFGNSGQRLIVRGFDKSHRLHRSRHYKAYLNTKDSDLASQIASAAGLTAGDVKATMAVHKYLVQLHQTDWDFLTWRAEENGLTVDVDDGKLNFRKPDPSTTTVLSLSVQETLLAFRPRISAPRAKSVTAQAWDEAQKQTLTNTQQVSTSTAAELSASPSSLASKFGSPVHTTTVRSAEAQGDVEAVATAVAARHADSFIEAEAVAYGSVLMKPGALVEIKDAGDTFNGKYRITAARHVFNAQQRWNCTMRFTGIQNKSLLALTSGNGGGSSGSRTPRIEGVVPATVTNVQDPDQRCRVKLKFPWLGEDVETEWARVMQAGAGPDRGAVILPEVGDEVLVAFEQGDIARPYVIGGLYNGKDKPDGRLKYKVDGGASLRGLASVTGHKLVLQDVADGAAKEGIHLITGDDKFEIYLNKGDKKITIDAKDGKIEIHGSDDVTIKSDMNISIEATQKLTLKGQSGVDINSASGDVGMSGINAKISGQAQASLSGNAGVEVKSSAIAKVQGSLVQIN